MSTDVAFLIAFIDRRAGSEMRLVPLEHHAPEHVLDVAMAGVRGKPELG